MQREFCVRRISGETHEDRVNAYNRRCVSCGLSPVENPKYYDSYVEVLNPHVTYPTIEDLLLGIEKNDPRTGDHPPVLRRAMLMKPIHSDLPPAIHLTTKQFQQAREECIEKLTTQESCYHGLIVWTTYKASKQTETSQFNAWTYKKMSQDTLTLVRFRIPDLTHFTIHNSETGFSYTSTVIYGIYSENS
ncbi:MAG: hypothetical protein HY832_02065 [Candidatus Aenigmarchaeota archaeon]|nr:hypothetical protein [Candidatus Aenigmarchaeota archaeon]